jgi:hypothetical protein
MRSTNSLKTGAALAVTVGIGYALCTFAFWLWPEAAANFMNALFHGLDFRKLQAGNSLFSFGSFLYGEAVLVGWAFALGALFGWLADRLGMLRSDLVGS